MYESEICAEGMFVTFPWWLKNVKSRSKIALFSNERHFEIWFPKKKIITFFWSKLSKLHKKDPILHVATSFSLKQDETRTSHGPIPHPLSVKLTRKKIGLYCAKPAQRMSHFTPRTYPPFCTVHIWLSANRWTVKLSNNCIICTNKM